MIRLFDIPHAEIAKHLATGAPVWLTVNPVEYHGPHLSLHNDLLVSRGLMRDLHTALEGRAYRGALLVADDLEIGVEPTPGKGSRFVPYQTARDLVVDACERLADLGAKSVVLLTFHGNPLHSLAIEAGASRLRARGVKAVAPFNRLMKEMLHLEPERFREALKHVPEPEQSRMLQELHFDFHAGFFETSVALHYTPESVSDIYKTLPPCAPIRRDPAFDGASSLAKRFGRTELASELSFAAQGFGWKRLKPFPGYTSAPHLATKEAGAIFARHMVEHFAEEIEGVLADKRKSPAPIMTWTASLSLGGRLA